MHRPRLQIPVRFPTRRRHLGRTLLHGHGFPGYGLGAKVDLRKGAPLPQGKELARGFMLNYNWYRHYFPITALGRAEKYLASRKQGK